MPAARSFRLPEELVERIGARARAERVSQTDLVSSLLDEGLKVRSFPGIVYRDGLPVDEPRWPRGLTCGRS